MTCEFIEAEHARRGLKKADNGNWLCLRCAKTELAAGQVFWCEPCHAVEKTEAAQRQAEERRQVWIAAVKRRCRPAFERMPAWEHTATQEAFEAKVLDVNLRKISEKWAPKHGSLLMLGPSGCGKTSAVARCLRRLEEALVAARLSNPQDSLIERELSEVAGMVWCTAAEITRELSQHRLGSSEPKLITDAANADVLIVDELGPEPTRYAGEIFDLIDRRYEKKRPTVATSGLTEAAFTERYGDAFFRRLTEKGIGSLVDRHKGGHGG